jgi:hypothetical protein
MDHPTTQDPRPPGDAPPAGPTPPAPSRIDWLFRDALRHRQIHPLMELLRRHRQQDAS